MTNNTSTYTDILTMNVSWLMEDLEPFENQFNILESMVCTIAIFIIFVMAIFVHRAFYRLMKRLPGRDINQVIFPYMVKLEAKALYITHWEELLQSVSDPFSANTMDTDPGVSGVSKDQKNCEKSKTTHCQVDHSPII